MSVAFNKHIIIIQTNKLYVILRAAFLFDNAAGLCYNVLLWSNAPKQLKGKFQWTRIRYVIFA